MSSVQYSFAFLALLGISIAVTSSAVIHPTLSDSLKAKERVNIIVSIEGGTKDVLAKAISSRTFANRGARATAAYKALKAHSDESQKHVLDFLNHARSSQQPTTFGRVRSFWISNQISVDGADLNLVQLLAELPGVDKIEEERIIQHQGATAKRSSPPNEGGGMDSGALAPLWNIRRMQAPEAWAAGFNGTGGTVAVIDTGARYTHILLRDSYKGGAPGVHAWYNPTVNESNPSPTPVDQYRGFGSFNLGLATGGSDGIREYGVAPGAKWIACKAFVDVWATQGDLLACGQFIACPHDYKGENHDCSQAPDVVTNSWEDQDDSDDDWFGPVVDAWYAAGVVPIFGAGHGGSCRTIAYPAEKENVIAVTCTQYESNPDISDYVTSYSSRGPARDGHQKPNVAAPGDNVSSADSYNDQNIVNFSGASQAPPHVAGLVAILRGARPELSYEEILNILQDTGSRNHKSFLFQCAFRFDYQWPNYHFGHGRVNASAAVNAALDH